MAEEYEDLALQVKNLQDILGNMGAYVFTKDLEGKYTFVNELVRELFDFPLEEIIGFDDSKFFSLELSNDIKINDRKVMCEGIAIETEEKNIIARTGETRYYLSVKKPLFDNKKNIIGIFGVSTDITEQKLSEQKLLETIKTAKAMELRKNLALQAGIIGIWEWNYDSNTLIWDNIMYKIYGIEESQRENPYTMWSNAIDPTDKSRVEANLFNAKETNGEYNTKFWITAPNKERRYIHAIGKNEFDENGYAIRMVGINTDITEYQILEDDIVAEKEKYKNLLQYASDGVFIMNLDGKLLECSQKAAELLGYSMEEMMTLYVYDWDIAHSKEEALTHVQNTPRELLSFETKHRRKDGSTYDAEISVKKISISGEDVVYASVRDITEKKVQERQLYEILQVSPIAVRIAKSDGQEVVFANKAYEKLLHLDDKTVIGKNPRDYYADPSVYDDIVSKLKRKETIYHKEIELIIDNKKVFALCSYMPIEYAGTQAVLGWFYDISIQKDVEERIKQSEDSFRSLFDSQESAVYVQDTNGTFLAVNEGASRMYQRSKEWFIGKSPLDISAEGMNDLAAFVPLLTKVMEGIPQTFEFWGIRSDGTIFPKEVHVTKGKWFGRDVMFAIANDITERKKQQNELEHIAHYDSLTGLPNRILNSDRLRQAMLQAVRRNDEIAILYLDLDGFKEVNDSYGHSIGDKLLISLSSLMQKALRDSDSLSRLGGDEFVALLFDLNDRTMAIAVIQRLLDAASQMVRIDDIDLQVSVSIGVVFYPQLNEIDADQLIRQADQAMYEAKQSGKNRFHIFDPEHDRVVREKHQTFERIEEALAKNEFVLYYQPKINMSTNELIGVEALIRWQDPQKGLISPLEFLPIIENHPLAVSIGEWVINEAIIQNMKWQNAGLTTLVSVNVGAKQLLQGDFVERLQAIMAQHEDFDPSMLKIEILETSALADIDLAASIISECNKIGVHFALDDFGTGYSSLTYLKRLPIVTLKIDQSFVRDMLIDKNDLAILKGIVGLASAFECEILAEGVETYEHGQQLLALGCEQAQGYGIARPMPADQLLEWKTQWDKEHQWKA